MRPGQRFRYCATLLCLAGSAGWAADSGQGASAPAERVERAQRQFGDVRFVMGAGQAMPWLEMYVGGDLVAAFREFDAQEVHASPDGKYFLAVSNRALSSLAYGVLDRQGRLVFSGVHAAPSLRYCMRGVARDWTWIDPAAPVARFELEAAAAPSPPGEYLKSVTVRSCDGRDLLLGKALAPRPPAPARTRIIRPSLPATDGNSFFIGNTIQNLRGLDPSFGVRTLTLIDGRRALPAAVPTDAPAAPPDAAAPERR